MGNFSNFLNIALLSVIILFGCCLSQTKADVTEVTDSPSFETVYQSIWGPVGNVVSTKEFSATLIDFEDTDNDSKRWGASVTGTTATLEGPVEYVCDEGSFIDPFTEDCYSCPEGFSHNPLKMVDEEGVCYQRYNLTTASPAGDAELFCPEGQFPDLLLQNCYSCPSGYVHDPSASVDASYVCVFNDIQLAQKEELSGCRYGEFSNASMTECYSCPSGYNHNPLLPPDQSGVCSKWVSRINTTASRCGTRTRTCVGGYVTDPFTGERTCLLWSLWNYSSCSNYDYRNGNGLYKCGSGYTHDWTKTHGTSGICYKPGHYDNRTATYEHSAECPSDQSLGADFYCYSCPSDYQFHMPTWTCQKHDTSSATWQGESTLICDEGEFFSVGGCYTCPSGMEHEPLLTASVPGVCYKQYELTAVFTGAWNQTVGCPEGQFLDVLSQNCYSCPTDYSWNPLYEVDEDGVCYGLDLKDDPSDGNFEVGYELNSFSSYKHGWNGAITIDTGSVDVTYSPDIEVTVTAGDDTPQGWQTYIVSTSQLDGSTLDMETRWPDIDIVLDPWTDSVDQADFTVFYPEQDPDTKVWSQAQDDRSLWDSNTGGQTTLGDDPLFDIHIDGDGVVDVNVLGEEFPFTGFDPPIEVMRDLVKFGRYKLGTVIVEGGVQPPAMDTPVKDMPGLFGIDRPYNGDYSEQAAFGTGVDGTYIKHHLEAGDRDVDFRLFALNSGLKDPDVLRSDLDLDGWLSFITKIPLGLKVEQPFKFSPVGSWWSLALDLYDLDFGGVFTFEVDYEFQPNLQVELTFSSPVRIVTGAGISGAASTHVVSLGEELRFVHPGGELTIDTAYSVSDNIFINNTNLNIETLLAAEAGSAWLTIFPVPVSYLPKISLVDNVIDLDSVSDKVMDVDFYDFDNDDTKSVFTLGGFSDVSGSKLMVTGVSPMVVVCQDITVALDENGSYLLTPEEIDGGSQDPGSSDPPQFTLSQDEFDCSNIGENPVTLFVTGVSGSEDSCDATVMVVDNTAPTALARDITVQLDASGSASISASDIDNGSYDNCGVPSLSVTPDSFTCSDTGANTVTLTVADDSGNSADATAIVTVVDSILPTALARDITIQLDASGNASIQATDVDNGSSDACGIASYSISKETFDCTSVGLNAVILTVKDNNNNVRTQTATVTVEDNILPVAITQDITVQLDETGHATVEAYDIDDGSDDACGIASLSVPPTSFDCSDIGEHTVTLTVTDVNGNSSTADAVVTVVDSTCPTVKVELVALELKKKKGCFEISVTAEDNCSVADVVADLNGYPVTDGMIVELKRKKRYKVKVKNEGSSDDGSGHRRCNAEVKFEGPDFTLTATVTDSSGNGGGSDACEGKDTDSYVYAFPLKHDGDSKSNDDGNSGKKKGSDDGSSGKKRGKGKK